MITASTKKEQGKNKQVARGGKQCNNDRRGGGMTSQSARIQRVKYKSTSMTASSYINNNNKKL